MGSITDFYEFSTCNKVDEVKAAELEAVDFDSVVYENAHFEVVPTIALAISGEPVVKYGVFNKETCVMEADAHQLITAKSWCDALAKAVNEPREDNVTSFPGLGGGDDEAPTIN